MSRPASPIGHGALGLRSNLRSFGELTEQSYCETRAYADVRFGKVIASTWTPAVSPIGAYSASVSDALDGAPLEIAAVAANNGDNLTRVRKVSDCTAGRFYFTPGAPGTLYVHLTGSANPNDYPVRADFVRRYGSVGTVEPLLAEEVLTGPKSLASYTRQNEGATGVAISETTDVPDGSDWAASFEVRPGGSGLAAASSGGISQAPQYVSGEHVIIAGAYKTAPTLKHRDGLYAALRVDLGGGTCIFADGRNTGGTVDIELTATGGEWRRFLFVFRSTLDTSTAVTHWRLVNPTGGAVTTGWIRFAELTVRPVYRYELVEPRLSNNALPQIEQNTESIFMGDESIGLASLSLLNSDGDVSGYQLEDVLGAYDVAGRDMQLYQGGSFDDGQEIVWPDVWACYSGSIHSFDVDDTQATFALRDTRTLLGTALPLETLSRTTFAAIADRDLGRPRAFLLGAQHGMRPPRVGVDATTGLPIWEVNDPTYGTGSNIIWGISVWAYADEDSANRRDTVRRVVASFSQDQLLGQVWLASNPGPFEIIGGASAEVAREMPGMNDALEINVGGLGNVMVWLTPGLYTAAGLAAHVQAQLIASQGAGWTCTYSNTTHLFTVTAPSGTFNIILATSATGRSAWQTLGFEGTADLTGSLSYSSSVALYDSTRADQFVIRIDAAGYIDHTDGRYTGVTGGGNVAVIYKAPDIVRFLLHKVLKRPTTEIDDAEFTAARTTAGAPMTIYLGGLSPSERLTMQQIVDRLQVSCHADIVIDGGGVWHWRKRAASAAEVAERAATAPVLVDRDFLAFTCGKKAEDTYPAVSLTYGEDPVTGAIRTKEANNSTAELRHGQAGTKSFDTAFYYSPEVPDQAVYAANVQAQAWNQMLLAVLPRRHTTFRVKGRLVRKLVTDLVKLQRTRMLGPELEGMLNEDVFRFISLSVDPQTHVCTATAYTADLPRNLEGTLETLILRGRRPAASMWRPSRTRDVASSYRAGGLV